MAPPRRQSGTRGRTRRKVRKNIAVGQAHIKTSFNNTHVALTDREGNVIAWKSAGAAGFKGSRKSTPFAAQVDRRPLRTRGNGARPAEGRGPRQGPGLGPRDARSASLQAAGLEIVSIKDVTPQAHNGCRPRKRRRV